MQRRGVRFAVMAVLVVVAASGHTQDWGNLAVISSTMGNNAGRICLGEGLRSTDVGCPTYAPSVTTAGDVSVTGNLSANKFIGDGSLLTGVGGQADRITSGTSAVIVNSSTSSISFTTGGIDNMLIDSGGNVSIGKITSNFNSNGYVLSLLRGTSGGDWNLTASLNFGNLWYVGVPKQSAAGYSGGNFYLGNALNDTTPALVVDSSSRIGIATTTPAATLQVSGSFIVSTSAQNTTPSLYVGTNGNVGIGTSAPNQALHMKGGTIRTEVSGNNFNHLSISATGITGRLADGMLVNLMGAGGSSGAFVIDVEGGIEGETNTSSAIIQSVGNIHLAPAMGSFVLGVPMVGTVSPVTIRPARGHTAYNSRDLYVQGGEVSDASSKPGGDLYLGGGRGSVAGDVILGHNGLAPLGNVGIGTTAPSATLTVSGGAIVSGTVQVAGTGNEACTPGTLGTIRFNPVTGAPQICVQR